MLLTVTNVYAILIMDVMASIGELYEQTLNNAGKSSYLIVVFLKKKP